MDKQVFKNFSREVCQRKCCFYIVNKKREDIYTLLVNEIQSEYKIE